ncbi:SPOR domain-containing protein [Derxia gummosa]|uniref:SPOR domain-containing protein n=1 Tax=Derxia gummosa DSM 723 TaxID=1121388 RepID=A0A8B6XAD4_9BURK|nr:SPOR domain-containing protein [Derxia gummosa]
MLDLRRKARRRLIGAIVLVVIAFIGLPMLVQSGKRPVAPDMPIEVVRDPQAMPTLTAATPAAQPEPGVAGTSQPTVETPANATQPAPVSTTPSVAVTPAPTVVVPPASREAVISTQTAQHPPEAHPVESSKPVAPRVDPVRPAAESVRTIEPVRSAEPPKPAPKPEVKPEPKPEVKPEPKPEIKSEPRPEPKPDSKPADTKPADTKTDGARALALLEGKPVAAAPAAAHETPGRFLVQMGAFATEGKVQELQARLRAAGVSTYTETINTASGPRIRLRAGPFTSRDAADSVRQKAAGAGIGEAAVLSQ